MRDRKHPHRLDEQMYRIPDEVVFITFCSRWDESLSQEHVLRHLIYVMGHVGHRRRVRVHAYCVMPDHLHVVVSVEDTGGDIEAWVRFTKREAARRLAVPGLWERSYWDRHARADEDVVAMVEYTLANPVRRELCERWLDWSFSWSEWHPQTQGPDPNTVPRRRRGAASGPGEAV